MGLEPGVIAAAVVKSTNVVENKKSGEYHLSHHIDLKTGFYKGKKVLDI